MCVCVCEHAHTCRSCLFSFLWFELLALVATAIVIFCLRWLNVYSFYVNFVHHVKLWFYAADLCFMNISLLLLLWLLRVLCVCGKSWSWRLWERTRERQSAYAFICTGLMYESMHDWVGAQVLHTFKTVSMKVSVHKHFANTWILCWASSIFLCSW